MMLAQCIYQRNEPQQWFYPEPRSRCQFYVPNCAGTTACGRSCHKRKNCTIVRKQTATKPALATCHICKITFETDLNDRGPCS